MPLIFVVLFMFCAAVALGDGLPIVDGKIDAEHTMIDLTESQAEEVAVLGSVTLTDDQWRQLKKISPQCPKRFTTLLPIDHNDCTCGYAEYLIMVSSRMAAVLHSQLVGDLNRDLRMLFTTPRPEVFGSRWDDYHTRNLGLRVDGQGRFYLGGVMIPYEHLRYMLSLPQSRRFSERSTEPVENGRFISFNLAPGVRANDAMKTHGRDLRSIAKGSGWSVNFYPHVAWDLESGE
jgi:hypothetical protein